MSPCCSVLLHEPSRRKRITRQPDVGHVLGIASTLAVEGSHSLSDLCAGQAERQAVGDPHHGYQPVSRPPADGPARWGMVVVAAVSREAWAAAPDGVVSIPEHGRTLTESARWCHHHAVPVAVAALLSVVADVRVKGPITPVSSGNEPTLRQQPAQRPLAVPGRRRPARRRDRSRAALRTTCVHRQSMCTCQVERCRTS